MGKLLPELVAVAVKEATRYFLLNKEKKCPKCNSTMIISSDLVGSYGKCKNCNLKYSDNKFYYKLYYNDDIFSISIEENKTFVRKLIFDPDDLMASYYYKNISSFDGERFDLSEKDIRNITILQGEQK